MEVTGLPLRSEQQRRDATNLIVKHFKNLKFKKKLAKHQRQ